MSLIDSQLTLREAHELLLLNGVNWTFGCVKLQVFYGRIPSRKIFSSRVVDRVDIMKIISKKRGSV